MPDIHAAPQSYENMAYLTLGKFCREGGALPKTGVNP